MYKHWINFWTETVGQIKCNRKGPKKEVFLCICPTISAPPFFTATAYLSTMLLISWLLALPKQRSSVCHWHNNSITNLWLNSKGVTHHLQKNVRSIKHDDMNCACNLILWIWQLAKKFASKNSRTNILQFSTYSVCKRVILVPKFQTRVTLK